MTAKLRLVRTYPKFYKSSQKSIREIDFIFHDAKGQRIHGSAPGFLAQKFRDFNLLEGQVYGINGWELTEDTNAFKITESSHKLEFGENTKMYEVVDVEYPRIMYNFKNYKELSDPQTVDSNKIFDLIGRVAMVHSIRTTNSNGVEKKFIDVVLEDVEGCHITCTFWERYVQVIVDALNNTPVTTLRVLIVQCCRAKAFQDGSIKVVNAFDATKLLMGEVPEIEDFKERYNSHTRPSESSIPHVRPFMYNIRDDLESGIAPIKTIAEFLEFNEETNFWIYASIIDVSPNWFFKSCPTCVRKLDISAVDDSGIVHLLCWDKDDDGSELPNEIKMLLSKDVMLKISKNKDQIGPYKGQYTVSRITADPILLNRFGPLGISSQATKAEELCSPMRTVKAEVIDSPIRAVNAEEVDSPIMVEKGVLYSPIRAVKAAVNSPNRAVKDFIEDPKKRQQTDGEDPMGKKKIKLEKI
ncbi:replication protein A 70 kDa DNA-binding subunit [Striga asiatica]|uniref:Replication protein A 70 kDa DNA-binding subunit n=1 Tax=Striga asiatica TaxID=4170 RepID=A0A5A7NY97_STRAF|nr:replication protein A 70 kDa DNA-binding subunit [Striga asiatica]